MNRKLIFLLVMLLIISALVVVESGHAANAQSAPTATPTPSLTPYPLPLPNALLVYDQTTATLINVSDTPISVAGVSFMRAGDVVRLFVESYSVTALAGHHCIEWWTVGSLPGKPGLCAVRDRWAQVTKNTQYFWVGSYTNEPFRPELNNSALTICNTSAGSCLFHIMQGDEAKKPWVVLDPVTGFPLPPGMQVAYDANQIWIGNLTPGTLLTTAALRVLYTASGKGTVWTPSNVRWDGMSVWDGRSLAPNQCLVMYGDVLKITPLLPCTPIAQTLNADHPWTLAFDVMGPREEHRSTCSDGKPKNGPVLCLLGG
jgi:hypothetical protein